MDLIRYALAQLRGGWRRTLATLLAVITAVTTFVLLTGSVATQRLEVTNTLESNFRGAYDILVRPKDSTLGLEKTLGLVRSNYLSGIYGGLTLAQVDRIKAIEGVEVAAPIAMVGTWYQTLQVNVAVPEYLPPGTRLIYRYRSEISARNGTAKAPGQAGYLYVTRNAWKPIPESSSERGALTPKDLIDGVWRDPCSGQSALGDELLAQMQKNIPILEMKVRSPLDPDLLWEPHCASTRPFQVGEHSVEPSGPLTAQIRLGFPMLLAAIDPEAEARLVGLEGATFEGRYLKSEDTWTPKTVGEGGKQASTPVLLANATAVDYQVHITLDRLANEVADQVLAAENRELTRRIVETAQPVESVQRVTYDAAALYQAAVVQRTIGKSADVTSSLDDWYQRSAASKLWRPGGVQYGDSAPLSPVVKTNPASVWAAPYFSQNWGNEVVPMTVGDTSYRTIDAFVQGARSGGSEEGGQIYFNVVGKYDPTKLTDFSALSALPLETYTSALVTGADAASKAALGDKPMLSDLNIGGYVQQAPTMLMPLKALPIVDKTQFVNMPSDAPVSVVRVRVANVTGMDDRSRERIRLVAERIRTATGLDVDITIGSSPAPQVVALPATTYGSPALTLNELWTKKGVALAFVEAIDAKSAVLFVLILVSSAVTVAVIARASVAARRRELGVLKASGWRGGQLTGALLVEAAIVGLAAGAVGALLAWPLTGVLGVAFDPVRAALAVPTAVALTVLASLAAAISAGRLSPVAALAPAVLGGRRPFLAVRGPVSLGLVAVLRRPGRLLAGALTVALGVGALLFLLAIARIFAGAVVGTLLGDAVAVQVRTPDVVAAALLAALGLIAVGVILYLGLIEDAHSYASLTAAGWRRGALARTVVTQALVIAAVGAALGIGIAVAALVYLTGSVPSGLPIYAAGVGGAALAASAMVALLPAWALVRLPLAQVLAAE